MKTPKVLILIGSKSDLSYLEETQKILIEPFNIDSTIHISSAHRTPEETKQHLVNAEKNGYDLIIAAAGLSAHLPGVCAAYTHLPVIGIPIDNGPLRGEDALHSIVMMPPGIPVGTMGIGMVGAKNAAVYSAQILSLKYTELREKVIEYKKNMAKKILEQDRELQEQKKK